MTITVHIHSNIGQVKEIPDGTADLLAGNNQHLWNEEFKTALEEFNVLVKKLTRPDVQPLSDYAVSRESIYEDHPKL